MDSNIKNNCINMIIIGNDNDIKKIIGKKFSFNNVISCDKRFKSNIENYMWMIDEWGSKSDALSVVVKDKKIIHEDRIYYNIDFTTKYDIPRKYLEYLSKNFSDIFVVIVWNNIYERKGGSLCIYKGIKIKDYYGNYFNEFMKKYHTEEYKHYIDNNILKDIGYVFKDELKNIYGELINKKKILL